MEATKGKCPFSCCFELFGGTKATNRRSCEVEIYNADIVYYVVLIVLPPLVLYYDESSNIWKRASSFLTTGYYTYLSPHPSSKSSIEIQVNGKTKAYVLEKIGTISNKL